MKNQAATLTNLERLREKLELAAIRHRNELDSASASPSSSTSLSSAAAARHHGQQYTSQRSTAELRANLTELADELSQSALVIPAANTLHAALIEQNRELLRAMKRLSDERRAEYDDLLAKATQAAAKQQSTSKSHTSQLSDNEREKFKKLYYKYLRAESFRKSLVYQKKFLLIMLSGYEETEREILATLCVDTTLTSNAKSRSSSHQPNNQQQNYHHHHHHHHVGSNSSSTSSSTSSLSLCSSSIASHQQNNCSNYNNNNRYSSSNQHQQQQQQQQQQIMALKTSTLYSNRFVLNRPKSRFRTLVICVIAIRRIK